MLLQKFILITAFSTCFKETMVTGMQRPPRLPRSQSERSRPAPPHGRQMTPSASFPARGQGSYSVSSTSSHVESSPSVDTTPTFDSPISDSHLAYLIQNKVDDPCKRLDPNREVPPDRNSQEWKAGDAACSGSYHSYWDIIRKKNRKGLCKDPEEAKCRLIKRRSTNRWEWTCTVLVRNPWFTGFITCTPFRVERMDWCVQHLDPPISLKSRRYDRAASRGGTLSSSEGGTPAKPVGGIPEED